MKFTDTEIWTLLDSLWRGQSQPTESEARRAGYHGETLRFLNVRRKWSKANPPIGGLIFRAQDITSC